MKRILFVINSMGFGGAERALVNLLSKAEFYNDFNVHVALLDNEPIVRSLPHNITLHQLDSERSLVKSVVNLKQLHNYIKPDVCISFLVRANVANALIRLMNSRCKTMLCERMHLTSHLDGQFSGLKRRIAGLIPWTTYRYADAVVGVSSGVTFDLAENFGVKASKAHTIFNPYNISSINKLGGLPSEFPLPPSFVVSTGRLTPAKNFKTLIDSYLSSDETAPLCILGEGGQKEELLNHIESKQAQERIILLGYADNPYAVISRAKYYVSASLNEGFPNALVEAMATGLPVIMTNCPSGPAEILNEDAQFLSSELVLAKHGLLVPLNKPNELTRALNVFQDTSIREDYAVRSRDRAQDFTIDKIANEYWQFIRNEVA